MNTIASARDMRAYVVSLVQREVKHLCLTPDATYQEVVAALGLPSVRFEKMPPSRFGCRCGEQIVINCGITCQERIEFTVFHEILHILIDKDGHIDSELLEYLASDSNHYRWSIEDFCNLGAAEWMMPSLVFRELLEGYSWKLSALRYVTEAFRCSLMAAAYQFAHWNPDPCHIVVCEYRKLNESNEPNLKLQMEPRNAYCLTVTHTARNETKYTMRRNVPVPSDHIIHQAWQKQMPIEHKAKGFFNNPLGVMECEAVPFGRRVYAVFYEKKRQWMSAKGQITLNFGV